MKRPSKPIGKQEVLQLVEYLLFLRRQMPGSLGAPNSYEGVLVGHHVTAEGQSWRDHEAQGGITVRNWQELLDVAERIHREFLDAMKMRVPDDVRVQALPPVAEPSDTTDNG